jgi:hypothetical protein
MKKCGLLIFVVALLALAAGCGGGGDSGVSKNNAQAQFLGPGKTCGAGYVRAKVPWGVKCLVHGELCKRGRASAGYPRWGFKCVKGRLVRK